MIFFYYQPPPPAVAQPLKINTFFAASPRMHKWNTVPFNGLGGFWTHIHALHHFRSIHGKLLTILHRHFGQLWHKNIVQCLTFYRLILSNRVYASLLPHVEAPREEWELHQFLDNVLCSPLPSTDRSVCHGHCYCGDTSQVFRSWAASFPGAWNRGLSRVLVVQPALHKQLWPWSGAVEVHWAHMVHGRGHAVLPRQSSVHCTVVLHSSAWGLLECCLDSWISWIQNVQSFLWTRGFYVWNCLH